jgi:hypothetical protein
MILYDPLHDPQPGGRAVMPLADYLDLVFERHRGTPRSAAPPIFQCPFCRKTWGTWTEPGLAAYYAGHPSYPREKNPPIHYTVCEHCSTVRHRVARMDDEKQRLADLRHAATLFPDSPEIREQTRIHAVALATLTRDLEDLLRSGDAAHADPSCPDPEPAPGS